jgi:hypothetical protein
MQADNVAAYAEEITKCLVKAQDGIQDATYRTGPTTETQRAALDWARTRIDAATILLGILKNSGRE